MSLNTGLESFGSHGGVMDVLEATHRCPLDPEMRRNFVITGRAGHPLPSSSRGRHPGVKQ